jgi:large subunit ribosomal protein L24
VVSGKDKGKKGKVLKVFPDKDKAIVEKINVVKRHLRANRSFQGGIIEKLLPLHLSKLMVVCPHCGKAARLMKKDSFRACAKCKEIIDKVK